MQIEKSWIHTAVQDHVNQNYLSINSMMQQVEQLRHQSYLAKQNIFHVDIQREQETSWIAHWEGAPVIKFDNRAYTPNFALQRNVASLSANENYKSGERTWNHGNALTLHSFIQRNAQGHIRQYVIHNGKEIRTSPWVEKGCTFVPWGPRFCTGPRCLNMFDFLSRGVCIDCLPTYRETPGKYNVRNKFLECQCSAF